MKKIIISNRPNNRRMKVRITKSWGWYKKGEIHEVGQYTTREFVGGNPCYEVGMGYKGIDVNHCKIISGDVVAPQRPTITITPSRGGYTIKLRTANGKAPNHIYNSIAGAKKGIEVLRSVLNEGEVIVKKK